MSSESMPHKLLLCVFSAWINRQQAQVIDYLVEENCVLKLQLSGRRLRLCDSQGRCLATKGKMRSRRLFVSMCAQDNSKHHV